MREIRDDQFERQSPAALSSAMPIHMREAQIAAPPAQPTNYELPKIKLVDDGYEGGRRVTTDGTNRATMITSEQGFTTKFEYGGTSNALTSYKIADAKGQLLETAKLENGKWSIQRWDPQHKTWTQVKSDIVDVSVDNKGNIHRRDMRGLDHEIDTANNNRLRRDWAGRIVSEWSNEGARVTDYTYSGQSETPDSYTVRDAQKKVIETGKQTQAGWEVKREKETEKAEAMTVDQKTGRRIEWLGEKRAVVSTLNQREPEVELTWHKPEPKPKPEVKPQPDVPPQPVPLDVDHIVPPKPPDIPDKPPEPRPEPKPEPKPEPDKSQHERFQLTGHPKSDGERFLNTLRQLRPGTTLELPPGQIELPRTSGDLTLQLHNVRVVGSGTDTQIYGGGSSAVFKLDHCDHVTFENINIPRSNGRFGIWTTDSNDITFKHCKLSSGETSPSNKQDCTPLHFGGRNSNIRIEDCDITVMQGGGNGHCVYFGEGSTRGITLKDNKFHHFGPECSAMVQFNGHGEGRHANAVIDNNEFISEPYYDFARTRRITDGDWGGSILAFGGVDGVLFKDNICNMGNGDIYELWNDRGPGAATKVLMYNNVFQYQVHPRRPQYVGGRNPNVRMFNNRGINTPEPVND